MNSDNRQDRTPENEGTTVPHPLDPLSAEEIHQAAAIVRRDRGVGDGWRFASIELKEPAKSDLPGLESGRLARREALVVCWDRADGQAYRGIVSLTADEVTAWQHLPGQQPNMTVDEWHECDEMLRAHPTVIEALGRRGITDMSRVLADMWAYGAAFVPERYEGRRIGWCDLWHRGSERGNPYAHHVTGLHPVVDLNTMELLKIEDGYAGGADPEVMGEYLPDLLPMRLREVAPLEISQPDGVGFTLDGNLLNWQNWQLRLGFNHRESLVLHQVAFADGERLRSVAHRLSFAEMVVPYRDPSPDHYRRTAFDIGEWGLGFMTTSLSLGCDCLGEITYLDAVVHDSRGEPVTIPNAICIHEEDSGVLWKHVDERAGAEVRRARRLVISFHATVANYEYLVYWRFYQDGNIECEVRATGIMVTSHVAAPGSRPANGTLVDQGIYAPFHQHFIVARLDLDVDGTDNTVYASDSRPAVPGPDDPYALGLTVTSTPLRTETEGKQDYDWATQRGWKVVNDNVANGLGTPVGYKLVPSAAFPPLLDPSSPAFERAKAIGHTLWVTPYHEDERWPCGDFPVQAAHDTGLPAWTEADRPIENTDVVLWYIFGIHHITRPEDWPVMPVDVVSFWLKPFGFFDRNPALDVPPSHHC
ncbi:MAG: primary-amine oxidase [Trebonia sp.]